MKTKHILMIVGGVVLLGGGYLLYKRLAAVKSPPLNAQAPELRSNKVVNTIKDIFSIGVAGTEAYSAAKTNLSFGSKKSMN